MLRQHNRRGVALVLYAIAMFTMMMCMGLALDTGYLYTQKGQGQLTEDIIALIVLGSCDPTWAPAVQQQYVVDQVNRLEVSNGLKPNFYTRYPYADNNGIINKLVLNAPNPLKTMMLNIIGIGTVNVGLEAIAVRDLISNVIHNDCPNGTLGLFGCVRVLVEGNPLVDSYNSSAGTYASQAVNLGCATGMGGHEQHLGGGGHGGHGDGVNWAHRNLTAMSNRLVDMRGNFCFHGDGQSSLDANVQGSGYVDGKITTEHFTGDSSLVADGVNITSVPDFNLSPAVGAASAATNDNGTVAGGFDSDALLAPNFQLKQKGSNKEILLAAGKKYYFKRIDLSGCVKLRIVGNPLAAGPVNITLDGDAKFNGDVTSDQLPTRPGWLLVNGINGCTECCVGCQSSGEGHRGGHGHHDDATDSFSMRPSNSDSGPLGTAPLQVGRLPGAGDGMLMLGSMGSLGSDDVPAWMRPGAINLAEGDNGDNGDDHGQGPDVTHDMSHDMSHNTSYHGTTAGPCENGHGDNNGSLHRISFAGNSTEYMDIYAPGYNVNTLGCTQFYGRIMAEDIQIKGVVGFHYDEDLHGCVKVEKTGSTYGRVHLIN